MPKKDRQYLPPVSWLFGRDLLASLKGTILYSVYGTKIDARAWMNPDRIVLKEGFTNRNPDREEEEFWFDYISDTGDSTRATYSIAYLALSDLYVKEYFQDRPSSAEDKDVKLKPDLKDAKCVLPRGQFLFVGGDTTYHMSDYAGLSNRFQKPFNWAFEDLKKDLKGKFDVKKRWLFGIPGNHDYYDLLDGFQRQFRFPVRDEQPSKTDNLNCAQLSLDAFARAQDASYVALHLPWNWQLWGLDTDVGKIDERQRDFFKKQIEPGKTADRLIVATSAPTTVFGQYAAKDDEKASKAFLSLGLPREFIPEGDERLDSEEVRLRPDQIRLDLAGDIHHYARYWGNDVKESYRGGPRPRSGRSKKAAASKGNYASVVSGLGGAFHHPSMTYRDDVREQVLYPSEERSRKAVAAKVFNPWNVKKGGWIWAMGLIMAFVIYFSATHVQTSRQAVSTFPVWNFLGIAAQEPITPAVIKLLPADSATVRLSEPVYFWGINGLSKPRRYQASITLLILSAVILIFTVGKMEFHYKKFEKLDENLTKNMNKLREVAERHEPDALRWSTGDINLRQVMDARKVHKHVPEETDLSNEAVAENKRLATRTKFSFYTLAFISLALFVGGVWLMWEYRDNNTPFGDSLMVLLSFVWAICAVILSFRYSDWLFAQSSKRSLNEREWWVTGVLNVLAILSVAAGLWVFGQNNLPAFLLSDIIFVVVVSAALILMIGIIPHFLGATYNTPLGEARLWGFGVWHAILQIFVAFLLVRKGTWITLVIAAILVTAFMFVGRAVMRAYRKGWQLLVVWIIYGLIMLFLPWIVFEILTNYFDQSSWLFRFAFGPTIPDAKWLASYKTYEWWASFNHLLRDVADKPISPWWGIVPSGLAGLVGAAMSCAWFGWYLGVSSMFNSHYNEAGGAARIEEFKQFIRIRLTQDTLTGYVIAVDVPKDDGNKLDPKLIDVFHLKAAKP